jgi:hypothetical protein
MADHLPAGRIRNAEVAVEEEIAQASPGEFGIAGLVVGKFVDDSVLIHRKASTVSVRVTRFGGASNFLAARESPCSQLHCAMRKSRQPRCAAAISATATLADAKLLQAGRNLI